jgi:hypothetical protein
MTLPISVTVSAETVSRPPLWFHIEDVESRAFGGRLRSCAAEGCPAVMTLLEPPLKVRLDRHWMFFIRAINQAMDVEHVSAIFGPQKAFTNHSPDAVFADYLLGKNLDQADNYFDKDRTCVRSVMTGQVSGDYLILETLDGNDPPPLKPGRRYPQRVQDIQLDDYLYNPRDHRWLFFAANNVKSKPGGSSSISPFDHGGIYDWTGDGRMYTWLPLVSRHQIYYPLSRLRKLSDTEPIPSPYRSA